MTLHRFLLITIVILVAVGGLMTIGQIWGIGLGWDQYLKAILTIGVLILLAAFGLIVKSDLGAQKDMKDQNYID